MCLNVNSNCELTLDGTPTVVGLEIIIHNNDVINIIREKSDYWETKLDEDGLYSYYILNFDKEPENIIEYIKTNDCQPVQEVFSICKLRKCLLQREKGYINDFLSNCSGGVINCGKTNSDNVISDFLLVSIFILEQLICCGNFDEATRILNLINNNGCGFCNDKQTTFNDCKCNG